MSRSKTAAGDLGARTPNTQEWPKPRLVVSACLGFDSVRYDGGRIASPLVDSLKPYVEFIPVCPEIAIGLGTPRSPVRLVQIEEDLRLVQPDTQRDLTEAMREFGETFLSQLGEIDGMILKSRSPSCAPRDARVYPGPGKTAALGQRPGLFGQMARRRFPDIPIEDEGRLTNRRIREHFLTTIFALARLRQAVTQTAARNRLHPLILFHTQYKFVLMAYSQKILREAGRLLANPEHLPVAEVARRYSLAFRAAMSHPPQRPAVVNVLMHALGYFSKRLTQREKAHFLDLLMDFREGRAPLSAALSLLQSWAIRFEEPFLLQQAFFEPFPRPLISMDDSGKGHGRL